MTRLQDVFIPGGQPDITYATRSRFHLERKLRDYVETGHTLFSITGPTKSGKTVLCRNVVPTGDAIWLSGGEIEHDDDVWHTIIDELDQFTSVADEDQASTEKETSSEIGAEVGCRFLRENWATVNLPTAPVVLSNQDRDHYR